MITVVSGVPRSGTSLMMQMVAAGGMEILTDGLRGADERNPRGYFEWEPIKRLQQEPGRIAEAEGKAVKVISSLLMSLPRDRSYQVLFMHRPLAEVVASQAEMIRRRGTQGAALTPAALEAALEGHVRQVMAWLERQPHMRVCHVHYHRLLQEPQAETDSILAFLDEPLNRAAMLAQIDPSLRRQRHESSAK
jgi:hypothetical protein